MHGMYLEEDENVLSLCGVTVRRMMNRAHDINQENLGNLGKKNHFLFFFCRVLWGF